MKLFEVSESQDYNKDIIAEDSDYRSIADIYNGLGIPNINTLHGSMYLSKNKNLKSLKNAPKEITKNFECFECALASLKNSPKTVGEIFDVANNKITSFKGSPEYIGGSFYCGNNFITSFEHCPSIIGGHFYCGSNNIKSLVGIHKHIKEIGHTLYLTNNPIEEGGIGLLLIKNIKFISADNCSNEFTKVNKIINKYLHKGKAGLLECQNELEEAGLERFAKL